MPHWIASVRASTALTGSLRYASRYGVTGMAGPKDTRTRPRKDLRIEVEPDGDHAQSARPLGLVAERQARGAGLDALHARLGVRRAFRIDRDQPPLGEGLEARLERPGVPLRGRRRWSEAGFRRGWSAK